MINIYEVTETNKMVEKENLDVRTITLGINLLDCASENLDEVNEKIYFGELTFTSLGGFMDYLTSEILLDMGSKVRINEISEEYVHVKC